MVIIKQNLTKVFPYLLAKLAGAGLALFTMSIILILIRDVDGMYEFVGGISYVFMWIIVFSLGTPLIDLLVYKLNRNSNDLKILLYMVAGYISFILNPTILFMVPYGIMGAVISLIIYFGFNLSFRSRIFKYLFSIIVPLVLLILINIDFTEKEGWVEVKTSTSYEATFDYFNGEHEIPIHLLAGESLIYSRDFVNTNNGGHGLHMLNEKNRKITWQGINDNENKFTADKSGVYRIVISGDNVTGSFKVNWEIE